MSGVALGYPSPSAKASMARIPIYRDRGRPSLRAVWRKGRTGVGTGRFCATWAAVAGVSGRRVKDSSFLYLRNGRADFFHNLNGRTHAYRPLRWL